jgi:hypothetical protein
MAISSAYRHHGDLHIAVLRFVFFWFFPSMQPNSYHDMPNKTKKKHTSGVGIFTTCYKSFGNRKVYDEYQLETGTMTKNS